MVCLMALRWDTCLPKISGFIDFEYFAIGQACLKADDDTKSLCISALNKSRPQIVAGTVPPWLELWVGELAGIEHACISETSDQGRFRCQTGVGKIRSLVIHQRPRGNKERGSL